MSLGELGARALGGGGAALLIILLIWVLLHVLVSILWARALAPALEPLGSPLIALLLIILPGLGAAIFAGYAALRSAGRGGSAPARWRPERPLRVGMLLSFALLFCIVPFLGWAVIRLGPFPNLRLDAVPILALFICDALLLCIAGYLARARASARGSLLLSAVGSVTLGFSLTILCALTALNSIADSLNGMGPTLGQALESQGVQAREIGISIWGLRLDGGLLPLDLPLGELSLAPGPGLILAALLSAALLVCAAVDTPRRAPRPGAGSRARRLARDRPGPPRPDLLCAPNIRYHRPHGYLTHCPPGSGSLTCHRATPQPRARRATIVATYTPLILTPGDAPPSAAP